MTLIIGVTTKLASLDKQQWITEISLLCYCLFVNCVEVRFYSRVYAIFGHNIGTRIDSLCGLPVLIVRSEHLEEILLVGTSLVVVGNRKNVESVHPRLDYTTFWTYTTIRIYCVGVEICLVAVVALHLRQDNLCARRNHLGARSNHSVWNTLLRLCIREIESCKCKNKK